MGTSPRSLAPLPPRRKRSDERAGACYPARMGWTDEEIVRGVADTLPFGVWIARAPGGEFVYSNATFQEIMGMGARDDVAVGEYALPYGIFDREGQLYPEDRMPFVRALQARAEVVVDDIVIHRRDGKRVYIRATARPVFDGDEISHVVIAFIDISREVLAERARLDTEARLRVGQRMESLGNLAGGIAHDFNNLLAVVRALASALREEESDPQKMHDLETIEETTQRAAALTRSLLRFSGRAPGESKPVRLSELVDRLLELFRRTLNRRIRIRADLDATATVHGDETQLEQVVLNLVVNAQDAMPDGGELDLLTYEDGQAVVLEVADTGSGIPPELRERIFDPYVSSKAMGPKKGTGLGLSIVHGIVHSHGGRIQALARPGGGTRMIVHLPRLVEGEAPKARPLEEAVSGPAAAPSYRGRGLALVVDDESPVRSASERLLRGLGFEVVSVAGGREALRHCEERGAEICLILLDYSMPDLDGSATLDALAARGLAIPVILTSGYPIAEQMPQLQKKGVVAFLPKPFGRSELIEVLMDHVPEARA